LVLAALEGVRTSSARIADLKNNFANVGESFLVMAQHCLFFENSFSVTALAVDWHPAQKIFCDTNTFL